jgi:hypothetical protein
MDARACGASGSRRTSIATSLRYAPGRIRETWFRALPRGAIIGAVNLVRCCPTEAVYRATFAGHDDNFLCGNFGPNRFAWERSEYQVFADPIPYRGAQGFFNVDEALVPEFRRAAA